MGQQLDMFGDRADQPADHDGPSPDHARNDDPQPQAEPMTDPTTPTSPEAPTGASAEAPAHTCHLPLSTIRVDRDLQIRKDVDPHVIETYRDGFKAGDHFPPVTVFFDGASHWLADGFHRVAASADAGKTDVLADVRPGTKRDALLFAVGANAKNSLHRSPEDKRRAVLTLLQDPEWGQKSKQWIADTARVSPTTVAKIVAEVAPTLHGGESTIRVGKDGRTINTANIGKTRKTRRPSTPTPPAAEAAPVQPQPSPVAAPAEAADAAPAPSAPPPSVEALAPTPEASAEAIEAPVERRPGKVPPAADVEPGHPDTVRLTFDLHPYAVEAIEELLRSWHGPKLAREMGIQPGEVTRADMLWWLIHEKCVATGCAPADGLDEFDPYPEHLARCIAEVRVVEAQPTEAPSVPPPLASATQPCAVNEAADDDAGGDTIVDLGCSDEELLQCQ